jgi:hypothetical protein
MCARLFCLILLFTSSGFLLSQSSGTISIPAGMPGDEIFAQPATLDLIPKEPGAHPGSIWIRSTDEGLHIWGKVQVGDDDLHWANEKSDMLASDHLEIWLSASPTVEMPQIGYGNQFGENQLASAADCDSLENNGGPGGPRQPKVKDCERWYNNQLQYRKLFERLFTRHWIAAGEGDFSPAHHSFEEFASSAWAGLNAAFFSEELPGPLEPHGSGAIAAEFNTESTKQAALPNAGSANQKRNLITGYHFHFFIPWSSFPPAQQLDLRDLWLMVDVFAAAPQGAKTGALATTSAARVWGKPSTFNHLVLESPRAHQITPCRAAATEKDMYGRPHPAWYFPLPGQAPLDLTTVYDIENPAGGYMYDPGGVSPIFRSRDHFTKTLPDGASVCGPQLAYRKGDLSQLSGFQVAKPYFDAKTLGDGWTLVRTGPDMSTLSPFGSGQCGACPVVDFHVYSVSPRGEIAVALDINGTFSGFGDAAGNGDFAIAPDWSRITFYQEFVTYIDNGKGGEKDSWTATSYCLKGHEYLKCGEEKNVKPPNPPNFKLEEQ